MKVLLELKDSFKVATGIGWTPSINLGAVPAAEKATSNATNGKPAPEKKKAKSKQVGFKQKYKIFPIHQKKLQLEIFSIFSPNRRNYLQLQLQQNLPQGLRSKLVSAWKLKKRKISPIGIPR